MVKILHTGVIVFLLSLALACGDDVDDDSVDTEDRKDTGQDTDTDTLVVDSGSDTRVCSEADLSVVRTPVALMLLVDMSGSMAPYFDDEKGDWTDTDNPGRWSLVRPAVETLLDVRGDGSIEFGYDVFPATDGACMVNDAPIIDSAPETGASIIDALPPDDAPVGSTPLWFAMENYLDESYAPSFMASASDRYLLIVSDGQDSCGTSDDDDDATAQELGALAAELLSAGVQTFTIGFGDGGGTGLAEQLDAISAAGGTDFRSHLVAGDQEGLESAFDAITSSIVSCTFDVPEQAEGVSEDDVNFYFDGEIVPRDDGCAQGTGWTYAGEGMDDVEFCGEACDALQEGDVNVTATWGCPTVIVVVE